MTAAGQVSLDNAPGRIRQGAEKLIALADRIKSERQAALLMEIVEEETR